MSNIYHFPQGKERTSFKAAVKRVSHEKKKAVRNGRVLRWLDFLWFTVRYTIALLLTAAVLLPANALYPFRKLLTYLTVGLGLVFYYTVYDEHFYKGTDFTLICLIAMTVIAHLGLVLDIVFLKFEPFFRLMRVKNNTPFARESRSPLGAANDD